MEPRLMRPCRVSSREYYRPYVIPRPTWTTVTASLLSVSLLEDARTTNFPCLNIATNEGRARCDSLGFAAAMLNANATPPCVRRNYHFYFLGPETHASVPDSDSQRPPSLAESSGAVARCGRPQASRNLLFDVSSVLSAPSNGCIFPPWG